MYVMLLQVTVISNYFYRPCVCRKLAIHFAKFWSVI